MWLRRRLLHQSQDQVQRSDRKSRSDQVDELPSCLGYLPLLEKGICLQDRTARLEVVADAIGARGDPNAHCGDRMDSVRLTDGRLGLPVVAVGGQLRVGTRSDCLRRVDSVDGPQPQGEGTPRLDGRNRRTPTRALACGDIDVDVFQGRLDELHAGTP